MKSLYLIIVFLIAREVLTKTVELEVRSAGCDDWCFFKNEYSSDNTDCLSSIKIDGKELLQQNAGLNIVILDIKTGNTEVKYISRLGGLLFAGEKARSNFVDMINSIDYDAVVTIVTLDMCFLRYSNWYNLLKNTKLKISDSAWAAGSNLAVVVGCIGKCPKVSKGVIPYLYSGPQVTFSTEFGLELEIVTPVKPTPHTSYSTTESSNQTINKPVNGTQKESQSSTIIIIVIILVLLLIVFVLLIFLFKTKHGTKMRRNCVGFCAKCRTRYTLTSREDGGEINERRMFPNAAYGKQSNVIMLEPNKKRNYENTDNENNIYASLEEAEAKETSRSQPNNYTYIDPKLDLARSEENLYYTATKDAMQEAQKEMMQRARSVTELTDISIEENRDNLNLTKPRSNTELSYLSVEPSTSQKIFKASRENVSTKPSEEISPTEKTFATYVQVAPSHTLYKVPSNVTRHKPPASPIPPTCTPSFQPTRSDQEEYVAMDGDTVDERTYDSCNPPSTVYQDLGNQIVDDNTYESLNGT